MIENQDVVHIRGDARSLVWTVTLDQSRTLVGTETWLWVLRRAAGSTVLLSKTLGAGITVDGAFQPTVALTAADFPTSGFPLNPVSQYYVHELQMTKDALPETVGRGKFTVQSDIAV